MFLARCELSHENKNVKQNRIEKINEVTKKPPRQHLRRVVGILLDKLQKFYTTGTVI